MTTPFVPTPRDALRREIERHDAAIGRWRIILQERQDVARFALEMEQDARDGLESAITALDDAYEALNALKRSERMERRTG